MFSGQCLGQGGADTSRCEYHIVRRVKHPRQARPVYRTSMYVYRVRRAKGGEHRQEHGIGFDGTNLAIQQWLDGHFLSYADGSRQANGFTSTYCKRYLGFFFSSNNPKFASSLLWVSLGGRHLDGMVAFYCICSAANAPQRRIGKHPAHALSRLSFLPSPWAMGRNRQGRATNIFYKHSIHMYVLRLKQKAAASSPPHVQMDAWSIGVRSTENKHYEMDPPTAGLKR